MYVFLHVHILDEFLFKCTLLVKIVYLNGWCMYNVHVQAGKYMYNISLFTNMIQAISFEVSGHLRSL